MRTWISGLHRHLNLGEPGRFYSELAASWLGVVVLAGLGLWIIRVRKAHAKRDLVRPNLSARGYRGALTWHTSLGVWLVLGALFLSATGITWSQLAGNNVSTMRAAFDWGTPAVSTNLTGAAAAGGEHAHDGGAAAASPGTTGSEQAGGVASANPATFDGVWAIAQRVNVNTGLVEIRPPVEAGTAWVVQEVQRSFPTEVDAVAIDGTTMQVIDRVDFAEFSVPAKLARWGIDIHMGSMFGLANQIVLFVIAMGIAAMVVLGYAMWWRRCPTSRAPGTVPARGVVRRAPWWGIAAVVAGAVLVGMWLPLVGWTLVAFVLLDTTYGAYARRVS